MIQRKNILIACDSPRSLLGFRGKLIEELISNHNVSVFTPRAEQDVRTKLAEFNVNIYESDLNTSNVSVFADLRYILKLHQIIRTLKPDVFFPYAFKPVIYGSFVAKYCNVACITPMLTGLGYNYLRIDNKRTLVQKITRTLLKLSLRASDSMHIILQNKDDYDTLLDTKTITRNNKAFIVNGSGVDLTYYKYSAPQTEKTTFLMISRLINAKGIHEYYQAAKIIRNKFPTSEVDFKLIGPYDDNIDAISEDLFNKIKTEGIIRYIGMVKDVRPYIEESSIVVLPSYYGEGVPRSILEAMAMGRAVITSDSVGCKETINSHLSKTNGFLVPVKNATELASKMAYFIEHPGDIVKFGINGREYAEEKFDVKKVNQQMLHILVGSKN